MLDIKIIGAPEGDWYGLYVNGKLYHEGHNIPHWVIFDALQESGIVEIKFENYEATGSVAEYIESHALMPKTLS